MTLDDLRSIERNSQRVDNVCIVQLLKIGAVMEHHNWGSIYNPVDIQSGADIKKPFCKHNKLQNIIRSQDVKVIGYEITHNNKCITVSSALN